MQLKVLGQLKVLSPFVGESAADVEFCQPHGRSSMTNDNQDKNQGNEDAQLVELVYHIKLPGQRKAVVH